MANDVEPDILVNKVLGKISDVLLNGDGEVTPLAEDHYLAFMSPGFPMNEDDFNYALEGFGGVSRMNVNPDDPAASIGPKEDGGEGDDGGGGTASADGGDEAAALASDARIKYQRAESFYAMTDMIPDTSGIMDAQRINTWNPEARLSSVYAMALQNSQVYDVRPDEELQAKLERWRGLLQVMEEKRNIVTDEVEEVTRESDLVKAYNEKMMAYLGAAMEYNNTRISALAGKDEEAVHRFALNASLLQMKVRAAMSDWAGNGYKNEYEQLTAAIKAVEGRSFALLKERYWEDFNRSILTNPSSGANFMYTSPAPATFARSDSGWSHFYFNSSSFNSDHSFKSSSSSLGAHAVIGGVAVGGSGGVEREQFESKIDAEQFRMEFEMCRAPIYRPWFHLDFLTSGFWRFDKNNEIYKNSMISDGKEPPHGLMPAITTECVFIKNLVLHFGSQQREFERKSKEVGGRAGAAFGPIFIGGKHSQREGESSFEATSDSQGIRIPGIQLLGFFVHTLPKAPDPNPEIQPDTWI